MPKNNLADHLKWLLAEKPFVPPTILLAGYDPNVLPSSSTTILQHESFETDFETTDDPVWATSRSSNGPVLSPAPQRAVDRQPSRTDRAEFTQDHPEMARLRATPGNGRPKLMLAEIPGMGTSSASATEFRRRSSESIHETDRSRPSRRPALIESTNAARAAPTQNHRFDSVEIDAIDLTSDIEDIVSPSSVQAKKGKKRKSHEYELDLKAQNTPRPMKKAPVISPRPFDTDEFINIDTVLPPPPDSPPPPYSTTATGLDYRSEAEEYRNDLNNNVLGFSVTDEDEEMAMLMADAEANTSPKPRKRKSLSRAASEVTAPPRKVGKPNKIQSPTKTCHIRSRSPKASSVRGVVQDSEDDDLENVNDLDDGQDDHGLPQPTVHKWPGTPEILRSPTSNKQSRKPLIPGPSSSIKHNNAEYRPKSKINPVLRSNLTAQPGTTAHSSLHGKESSSQSKLGEYTTPQLQVERSREQRDLIRQTVEELFHAEGHRLKSHLAGAWRDWNNARDASTAQNGEFDNINSFEVEKMQQARARADALTQIIELQIRHEHLIARRGSIKKKIVNNLDEGNIDHVDSETLRETVKALDEVQAMIYSLLIPAGLKLLSKCRSPDLGTSRVVVRSTQAAHTKTADTPHVPQTELIKQTEISVREVWTPSRSTRFREAPLAVPPSINNFTTKVKPTSKPPDNSKSEDSERPHRIPETPERSHLYLKLSQTEIAPGTISHRSYHQPDVTGDDFDEDEHLFSNHMGSPPRHINEDEDFCEDDDDDFMAGLDHIEHQAVEQYDWKGDRAQGVSRSHEPHILRETSVNQVHERRLVRSPKKSQANNVAMNHPWSREVKEALLRRFKLKGFRPGQLEAVNATLGGNHCFVLMPTGGGKSLCYQLPSVIRTGKTRGVTLVISPLLSLMEDQVEACRQRFGMQAQLINGESTRDEKEFIMQGLQEQDPQQFIQLLYVTPEMLSKNQRMVSLFQTMHQNGRLARIVIDEAHCVSQWGHDFRPDYKALGDVLRNFHGVPIIALTATATRLVQKDVMVNLGIEGCRVFSQSFNRPNLSYEVMSKSKNVVASIASLIKEKHANKCGIVYCLARKTCEKVAEKLSSLGIRAHHYHAGMEAAARSSIQRDWQNNKYRVIVATIAFGMGIDKADVRFVIHHSLPKSLEGYYQETGRAGRDGKRSDCYLYYVYSDCKTLRKMIDDGDGNREQKQRQHDMLRNVIQFCENRSDCRRVQVLNYFSESFRREDCHNTCDNCRSDATYEEKDLTEYAVQAIRLVQQVEKNDVTLHQCVDAFRGSKTSRMKDLEVEGFGFGENLERGDVERLFTQLFEDNALRVESVINKAGFPTNYVHLGMRSRMYQNKKQTLRLQVRVTPRKPKITTRKLKERAREAAYPSTNISSPIQGPSKRTIRQYMHEEENDDDNGYYGPVARAKGTDNRVPYERDGFVVDDDSADEERFKPIRKSKATKLAHRKELGHPITVDERVAGLDDFQQDVLHDFMTGAKKMAQGILIDKSLRSQPFSDTILREMGLDLPTNLNELLAIPGINTEMVKLYGKKFLPLIQRTKEIYGANKPVPRNQLSRRSAVQDEEEDDEEEEDDQKPKDPNHLVVVDLCSSGLEDNLDSGGSDNDSNLVFDAEDEEQANESSQFFKPHPVDPRVEEYNRRASQLEAQRQATSTKASRAARSASKPPPRPLPWKKGAKGRRNSSNGTHRSSAGIKKGAGKKSAPRGAPGSFTAARKPGRGGGGGGGGAGPGRSGGGGGNATWSSIMAMPT